MTEQVIPRDDRAALARELIEYVAATDLTRLSTEELNDLSGCARWLRVEPDDGYEAVHIVNGLVAPVTEDVTVGGLTIRASQDEHGIEGDDELTAALNAAVEEIDAEIARRMPHEVETAWKRYERYARRRPRSDLNRARSLSRVRLMVRRQGRAPRRVVQVSQRRRLALCRSSDDDPHDPAPPLGGSTTGSGL
jgi:hypothetical protein